jgi:RNA polymerase sigma factor (sigma-70 family)
MATSVQTYSDEHLWQEIQAENQEAWKALVMRYKSLVYAVCTFMGLSQSDAADCFQQTWAQLFQHRRRLADPSRISSWLVTTARREAMHLQRQSRRFVDTQPSGEIHDPDPLPDRALEELELQAQLENALRQIDQPCRKLLNLFFFADEDMTYDQIAVEMGLAPNTLGAKRHRCLAKLREILSDLGYEQERNEP